MATYKLIVVGDSISDTGGTWGTVGQLYMQNSTRVPGGTINDYWVKQMQAWLASTYPQHTFNLVNLALSGYTTWKLAHQNEQRLTAANGGANADFAVYFLGVNDYVYGGSGAGLTDPTAAGTGSSLAQQSADLDLIIPNLPARGIVVSLFPLWSGCPNYPTHWDTAWWPSGNPGYSDANNKPYLDNAVTKILAAKPGWRFADLYSTLSHPAPSNYYNTIDGLHPGILGQGAIWSAVQPQMSILLSNILTATSQTDHISLTWTDNISGETSWRVEKRKIS